MPKKLMGRKLTAKEHRQWKHVQESEKARGLSEGRAAAAATSTVKKSMKKGKGGKKGKKHG